MPPLDSKVGDLAYCYGKREKEGYEIKMVCCKNVQYG